MINYRESYGIYTVNGILFNHESELRSESFVTRKITSSAVRIKLGKQDCLFLGNIDSYRDWSYAKDLVEGIWLSLQMEEGGEYCFASGELRSVREFVECSFECLDIRVEWKGEKNTVNEYAVCKDTGKKLVGIDEKFFRPSIVDKGTFICGDTTKVETLLGWKRKVSFKEMIRKMIDSDLKKYS